MSSVDENFSSRIFEERKRLGLSQAKAGEACGVSREIWGRYESGKAIPGGEVLFLFAAAGADVAYILAGARSGSVAPPALKPREAALLDNYRHCPQEGQEALEKTSAALAKSSGKARCA